VKPKTLLVNLPYTIKDIDSKRPKIRSYLGFPYGILSLATFCQDIASFQIIDCDTLPDYNEEIERVLSSTRFDIIGFGLMFDTSYKYLRDLLSLTRKAQPTAVTLLGGAAASYSYQEIISEQPDLDAICFAEGELALRDFILTKEFNNSAWVTREAMRQNKQPQKTLIDNLDSLINLDYSLVNHEAYDMQEAFSPFARHGKKCFFISSSRGCFGNCTFCSNSTLHGKRVRQASVECLVSHVRHLVENYGMETLIFYDDQLLINMPRAKVLFKRLAEFNLRIEAPNGLSVRYLDEEMAGLMRRAGMDTAYLAIESGCALVLREFINKPLELWQVKPAVKALRDNDFFIHGFLVMGMPGETDAHRLVTRRFLEDVDLDWCGFNMATPVRGSRLYDDCIKNGWIKKQRIEDVVDKKYIIHVPGTDPEKIEAGVYQMNLDINFHNNRRMRIGDYKTAKRCFEEVIKRYSGHEVAKHYLRICEEKIKCVTN